MGLMPLTCAAAVHYIIVTSQFGQAYLNIGAASCEHGLPQGANIQPVIFVLQTISHIAFVSRNMVGADRIYDIYMHVCAQVHCTLSLLILY